MYVKYSHTYVPIYYGLAIDPTIYPVIDPIIDPTIGL